MSYEHTDRLGDRLMIETDSSVMGYPALTVWEHFLGDKPHRAAVYLPSDPVEVEKLVRAILDASGCTTEPDGHIGWEVVKRDG